MAIFMLSSSSLAAAWQQHSSWPACSCNYDVELQSNTNHHIQQHLSWETAASSNNTEPQHPLDRVTITERYEPAHAAAVSFQ